MIYVLQTFSDRPWSNEENFHMDWDNTEEQLDEIV